MASLDRKSSIENEPRTLNIQQFQLARVNAHILFSFSFKSYCSFFFFFLEDFDGFGSLLLITCIGGSTLRDEYEEHGRSPWNFYKGNGLHEYNI